MSLHHIFFYNWSTVFSYCLHSLYWELKMISLAAAAEYASYFDSAMLVGDIVSVDVSVWICLINQQGLLTSTPNSLFQSNAMMCRHSYCVFSLFIGEDMESLSKHFSLCIQQAVSFYAAFSWLKHDFVWHLLTTPPLLLLVYSDELQSASRSVHIQWVLPCLCKHLWEGWS